MSNNPMDAPYTDRKPMAWRGSAPAMNKHGLKPCPLCGDEDGPEYIKSDSKSYGYVHCANCGLHLSDNIADDFDRAAIRAWNDRTKVPPT